MNRLASETSPYLLQHAGQPRRLVPVGRGGARPRARGGPADPPLHRLRGVPLVPRDGARVLRGRGDGAHPERAFRQRQGRPRGAPGPRRGLHGRGRHADRARRLAADRVPDARRRAVLRRHVLPARAASRPAELSPGAGGGVERVPRASRGRRPLGVAARRGDRPRRTPRAVVGAAHRVAASARRCAGCARRSTRSGAASGERRSSRRTRCSSCCCGAARRRWPSGRSTGWRPAACTTSSGAASTATPSTTAGSSALREDALRQRAPRPGVSPRVARHRPRALPRGGRGDGGLHAPRPAAAGRRVRVVAGRGHRRRRGTHAHVDGGRRRAGGAARAVRARALDRPRRARSRLPRAAARDPLRAAAARARRQGDRLVERPRARRPRRGGEAPGARRLARHRPRPRRVPARPAVGRGPTAAQLPRGQGDGHGLPRRLRERRARPLRAARRHRRAALARGVAPPRAARGRAVPRRRARRLLPHAVRRRGARRAHEGRSTTTRFPRATRCSRSCCCASRGSTATTSSSGTRSPSCGSSAISSRARPPRSGGRCAPSTSTSPRRARSRSWARPTMPSRRRRSPATTRTRSSPSARPRTCRCSRARDSWTASRPSTSASASPARRPVTDPAAI